GPDALRGRARGARATSVANAASSAVCLAAVALLVGVRWLRYSGWDPGPPLDGALAQAMVLVSQSFLWSWAFTTHEAGTLTLAIIVVVIGLHRRLPGRI